jgi:tetratricopeptide (TPR) repeat protein
VRAPPRYRLATAVEVTAGPGGAGEVDRWRSIIERELGDFVARTAFLTAVSRSVSPEGWSRRRGVDYLLLAEARLGEEGNRLELSLINPRGQAVVRQAVDAVDSDRLRDRVAELLGALGAGFPVAGSVKRVSGDTVWLNIGKDRILAVGDVFIDRLRRVRVEVSEVADREAQALVRAGRPRVGLQLTRRRMIGFQADSTALYLTVLDDESGESLENAAIYRDGLFCGASDAEGKAAIPVPQDQPYRLEVSKLGYETHDERIRHAEPREHTVRLKLEYCTLQVSSFPTGSQIFLDGVRVGTAPLEIRTTLGIHTLRAVPQDREQFETYRYPGKLILEQPREEIKIVHRGNYLAKARELLPQRRFKEAAELLRHVPRPREGEDPAGYIEAQFELGRLYLDQLQNPRGAIESFRNVIEFDHRYAMAHLNLGLAFYKARDYERAISQLERAKRYKSFFPKDRYEVCVGDALFYRAMAAQKLSELRPGRPGVERACQLWDEFLDFYRRLPAQRRPLLRETYDIAASLEAKNCR